MKWYHYFAAVGAGFCFANTVPHGVAGMMGETFPSPFSNPPGIGHSSAFTNVIWALTNLSVGYIFLRYSKVNRTNKISIFAIFVGIAIAAVSCSIWFSEK